MATNDCLRFDMLKHNQQSALSAIHFPIDVAYFTHNFDLGLNLPIWDSCEIRFDLSRLHDWPFTVWTL